MQSTPDLMAILVNIGRMIPDIIMLMQVCSGFVGFFMIGTGIIDFVVVNSPGSEKHFAGARSASNVGATFKLIFGGFFLSLATLQMVGILSRSITGDYVNSRMLSYNSGGGSLEEQRQLATLALLGIMQVVGFAAVFRSGLLFVDRANGKQNVTIGKTMLFLIGGLLAWNFKWTTDVINNQLGYNIIALFTPWQ